MITSRYFADSSCTVINLFFVLLPYNFPLGKTYISRGKGYPIFLPISFSIQ